MRLRGPRAADAGDDDEVAVGTDRDAEREVDVEALGRERPGGSVASDRTDRADRRHGRHLRRDRAGQREAG